jgi:hypothetical protein
MGVAMTELDELMQWIKRVNIPYQIYRSRGTNETSVEIGQWYNYNKSTDMIIMDTSYEDQSKVGGYTSFYHEFVFDAEGKLLISGSWE